MGTQKEWQKKCVKQFEKQDKRKKRRVPVWTKEEEAKRFAERATNPLKKYKLSPTDQFSQTLWDNYTVAEYSMFMASDTDYAPWTVINSNDKKKARIKAIKHILNQIDYPDKIKKKHLKIDKKIILNADDKIAEFDKNVAAYALEKNAKKNAKA